MNETKNFLVFCGGKTATQIQYNGNSENRQHDKLFFLRLDYSLVIIRNEMILNYILQNIYITVITVKKHDILVKSQLNIKRSLEAFVP